jgi:hypothetical protein
MIAGPRRATVALAMQLAAAAAGIVATAASAQARSEVIVPYPSGDVWPSAIRFLRVDQNYPIKEKDEPSGYVLFELPENKRSYRAALEMVKTTDNDGRAATQLICTIQDLPRRYELSLLDKLTAKVRDERGPPAPPVRKPRAGSDPGAREPKPEPKPDTKPEPKPDTKSPGDLSDLPRPPTWGPPPQP